MPSSHRPTAPGLAPRYASESGNVLILIAVTMTMLLALAAFSLTVSNAYDRRNLLHAAADQAAKVAAAEVFQSPSLNDTVVQNFGAMAVHETVANGGMNLPGATVVMHRCSSGTPCAAPWGSLPFYVEATVSQAAANFLAFMPGSLTPSAHAVAGTSPSQSCLVTFMDTAWGSNTHVTAPTCDVGIGGNLDIGAGTSSLEASSTAVTGSTATGGTFTPAAQVNAPFPGDPLVYLPAMADPGNGPESACPGVNLITTSQTINPGKYCGIQFRNSGAVLTLAPGAYYITGVIDTQNPGTDIAITGSGVVLYIQGSSGRINLDANNVTLTLTAPTSGTYAGVAIMQDRSNTQTMTLGKNNGDINITGAVYSKNGIVEWKNNGTVANGCTQVVAKTLDIKNNTLLNLDKTCSTFTGGSALKSITIAE